MIIAIKSTSQLKLSAFYHPLWSVTACRPCQITSVIFFSYTAALSCKPGSVLCFSIYCYLWVFYTQRQVWISIPDTLFNKNNSARKMNSTSYDIFWWMFHLKQLQRAPWPRLEPQTLESSKLALYHWATLFLPCGVYLIIVWILLMVQFQSEIRTFYIVVKHNWQDSSVVECLPWDCTVCSSNLRHSILLWRWCSLDGEQNTTLFCLLIVEKKNHSRHTIKCFSQMGELHLFLGGTSCELLTFTTGHHGRGLNHKPYSCQC